MDTKILATFVVPLYVVCSIMISMKQNEFCRVNTSSHEHCLLETSVTTLRNTVLILFLNYVQQY